NLKLATVTAGNTSHKVCVVVHDGPSGEESAVISSLQQIGRTRRGDVSGLLVMFDRYAKGGRQALTKEMFHQVDAEQDIWEFKKGDIRAIGFVQSGSFFV